MKIKVLVGVFLFIIGLFFSGCVSSVQGTYQNEKTPENKITLDSDFTYILTNNQHVSTGTYKLSKNNTIILTSTFGLATVVKVDGNVMIDDD
jgi:hypothetical protein